MERRLATDADPQVRDVARRCALVAAAGELAISGKILPWKPGEAEKAAWFVLNQWIAQRGGSGSAEEEKYVAILRTFLTEHGPSRFVSLCLSLDKDKGWTESDAGARIINRAGWRRPVEGSDSEEFLIAASVWSSIFAPHQLDPKAAARVLKEKKHLVPGADGKSSSVERVPGISSVRVYRIKPTIFSEG